MGPPFLGRRREHCLGVKPRLARMNSARQPSESGASSVSVGLLEEIRSRARPAFAALEPGLARDLGERLEGLFSEGPASPESLSSLLMEGFAKTRDLEVFSLLYEATHRQILLVILKRIRFTHSYVDPKDVLQDVYLSIYRYPHRFRNEKSSSFRNWSFSIVRNTLLKHLRSSPRTEVDLDPLAEVVEDERTRTPITVLADEEETQRAAQSYALCLLAYRKAFQTALKDREKKALRLIEVRGLKYRDAAEQMDVRLENLKMIVCRARKKLLRSIEELLEVNP